MVNDAHGGRCGEEINRKRKGFNMVEWYIGFGLVGCLAAFVIIVLASTARCPDKECCPPVGNKIEGVSVKQPRGCGWEVVPSCYDSHPSPQEQAENGCHDCAVQSTCGKLPCVVCSGKGLSTEAGSINYLCDKHVNPLSPARIAYLQISTQENGV